MNDCRFGVSPVNYPDPDPDPGKESCRIIAKMSFFLLANKQMNS